LAHLSGSQQILGSYFPFLHFSRDWADPYKVGEQLASAGRKEAAANKRSAAERLNNRAKFRATSAGSNIKDSAVERAD
jgi:hypothetical protein